MDSLYSRLGGKGAIEAAVKTFYDKVLADDRIKHFFENVDMIDQRTKQHMFLSMVFGGPQEYRGKELREGHKHLPGLNDGHYDAVVEHLGSTLQELGVGADDREEVAKIAESVRDDVLNR